MSKIKEILCMPHSHYDLGYTHPQSMLEQLQYDYIDDAINLCISTSDYPSDAQFKWTIEATYPLMGWMKTATKEKKLQLKQLIKEKRISVAALPFHTTPGVNATQIEKSMDSLAFLRKKLDIPIDIAINHDINGQPWTYSNILQDFGINFYLTGINIHFGGVCGPRPYAFNWQAQDGRNLTSYLGEHYSLFSQFFYTEENSVKRMHQGVCEHLKYLDTIGYDEEYFFLTATNPPMYDNNCPDMDLPRLVKEYNDKGYGHVIKFATPEDLRERVFASGVEKLPVKRGDWTDFWNFGSASTAREASVVRRAKENLRKAEVLSVVCKNTDSRYKSVVEKAYNDALLYEEHTWGASQSITDTKDIEVYSQELQKKIMAYEFADMSAVALNKQIEAYTKNEIQAMSYDGIAVVNTSEFERLVPLNIPNEYKNTQRHISYQRIKSLMPFAKKCNDTTYYGSVCVPAYSKKKYSFKQLDNIQKENSITIQDELVITPFYEITYLPNKGRILQIKDRKTNQVIIDEKSSYTLFEPVQENLDMRFHNDTRSIFFPRDIDLANHSISVWNHDWKAVRTPAKDVLSFEVFLNGDEVIFAYEFLFLNAKSMHQEIKFSVNHNRIITDFEMDKEKVDSPDSTYVAIPLNLDKNWECSFDTAGTFAKLDDEQIGTCSKDWVTVDTSISLYTNEKGYVLSCPDAPVVMPNGFGFGRESKFIERSENPCVLAWPLNNYWETNFVSSQPGIVRFSYELTPVETYSDVLAKKIATEARIPCLIYPIVNIDNELDDIIQINAVNTFVERLTRDVDNQDDILVLLKNYTNSPDNVKIVLNDKQNLKFAQKENTAHIKLQDIVEEQRVINVQLNAYEMAYVRLILEND